MTADEAFERLKQSLERGRLAHAYTLVGDPREAGRQVAERLLQLLHCRSAARPCGVCPACRQVAEHAHPDLVWIEPQSKARQIVIEQIREEVLPPLARTPLLGGWKTCVLAAADRMNEAAANAFLKTLEEPSGQTLFLLLTDKPQFLLPTIASRCQELVVGAGAPEPPEPWRQRLLELLAEDIELDGGGPARRPDFGAALARAAGLIRLLRELRAATEEELEAEEREAAAARENAGEAEEEEKTWAARLEALYRERRTAVLRALLRWQRDVLLLVCGAGAERLHYPEWGAALRRQAAGSSYAQAVRNVRVVETMQRRLERNLPEAAVVQGGFGEMAA